MRFSNSTQTYSHHMGHHINSIDRTFDRLFDYATHQATSTGFPPYNIVKDGDYNYTIEMALAGYSKKDIEVEVRRVYSL